MPTENPRVTITLPPEELEKIEYYRFEHKFMNRTQAILDLIQKGLLYEKMDSSFPPPLMTRETLHIAHGAQRLLSKEEKYVVMAIINNHHIPGGSILSIYKQHIEQANEEAYECLTKQSSDKSSVEADDAFELIKNRGNQGMKNPPSAGEESGQ